MPYAIVASPIPSSNVIRTSPVVIEEEDRAMRITVAAALTDDRFGWIPDVRRDPLGRQGCAESSRFPSRCAAPNLPLACSASSGLIETLRR